MALIGVMAVMALVFVGAGPGRGGPPDESRTTKDFEEIVFVDFGVPFHGGPAPHVAEADATNFHLTRSGIRCSGSPTIEYSVSTTGGIDDCGTAAAAVELGLDEWEVSGVTFSPVTVSPDTNRCNPGSGNEISWASGDGSGGTLAVALVCVNSATKEIVGFRVIFDSDDSWSVSGDAGKFDIQATMAHEAGHVIGLGHVHPPKASRLTMAPSIGTADTGFRTLGCGDRLGVNAAYDKALDCASANVSLD